ncbi:MAG TPA: class I SAM-dependent methyltransferase [Gemmataceae bacterium]|nr:class I SAM-dependent methyltransferase [Gemmataceae bacterium]
MKMMGIEKHFVNGPRRAGAAAREAQELLGRIDAVPGWRYLDVGCGVGSAARAIAEREDLDVTGVDVDPAQIATANAGATRPNLRFVTMDATSLPFCDAEFHIVSTSMATHHIQKWELALSEMVRVLRPGGYLLYVDLMFPEWLARAGRLLIPFMGFPSAKRLESYALRAGLATVFQARKGLVMHAIYRKAD